MAQRVLILRALMAVKSRADGGVSFGGPVHCACALGVGFGRLLAGGVPGHLLGDS